MPTGRLDLEVSRQFRLQVETLGDIDRGLSDLRRGLGLRNSRRRDRESGGYENAEDQPSAARARGRMRPLRGGGQRQTPWLE